jgi:general stress protein YciG
MAGTKFGGLKASETNRKKYGPDFYKEIGRKGGKAGHTGGFAANPALAKIAGKKGGHISRRTVGVHSGDTSLRSLIIQCDQRKYDSIKVQLDNDLVLTIAADQLKNLAAKCGASSSFKRAFASMVVVPS